MSSQSLQPQQKAFYIGIDSDGTVFDSMEIKHKRVFQPVAIELWGLHSVEAPYCKICESINLYSVLRGINRFQGLALAFERIVAESDAAAQLLEGHEALQTFVQTEGPFSFAALSAYNAEKNDAFLSKVLEWSRQSDELYNEIMQSEGSPTFPGIRDVLERASENSEIVVVSSSSRVTLEKDWGEAGLLPLVTRVEGQEQGSKSKQLESAVSDDRDVAHALMMGDALSDLEAAREHGILFYPITPGAEAASWERFKDEALNRFYDGSYAGAYEASLLAEFEQVLQPDSHS